MNKHNDYDLDAWINRYYIDADQVARYNAKRLERGKEPLCVVAISDVDLLSPYFKLARLIAQSCCKVDTSCFDADQTADFYNTIREIKEYEALELCEEAA